MKALKDAIRNEIRSYLREELKKQLAERGCVVEELSSETTPSTDIENKHKTLMAALDGAITQVSKDLPRWSPARLLLGSVREVFEGLDTPERMLAFLKD